MSSERRFNDQEVSQILERASVAQEASRGGTLPSRDGLTLASLKELAAEVGIGPEYIQSAVREVRSGLMAPVQRTRFLGLPIGVARTTYLERKLTDAEWEELVGLLRVTFRARGHMRVDGSFRQWTNGNLQILLEPTRDGQRVRMSTRRGEATAMLGVGATMATFGAVAATVAPFVSSMSLPSALGFAAWGLGLMAWAGVRLPSWARERADQMQDVAARLSEVTAPAPPSLHAGDETDGHDDTTSG
jgi:hypothetical protein